MREDIDYFEKKWLAHASYNIYILFNSHGTELSQEEYLNSALALFTELEDKSNIGNCINSLAVQQFKLKKFNEALESLFKAYTLAEEEQSYSYLSKFSANIGLTLASLNREHEAMAYFEKQKKIDAILKSDFHFAYTHNQLGETYCVLNKHRESIPEFLAALLIFEKLNLQIPLTSIYKNLADSFANINEFEQAYIYSKKHAQCIADHFNDEKHLPLQKQETHTYYYKKKMRQNY